MVDEIKNSFDTWLMETGVKWMKGEMKNSATIIVLNLE